MEVIEKIVREIDGIDIKEVNTNTQTIIISKYNLEIERYSENEVSVDNTDVMIGKMIFYETEDELKEKLVEEILKWKRELDKVEDTGIMDKIKASELRDIDIESIHDGVVYGTIIRQGEVIPLEISKQEVRLKKMTKEILDIIGKRE